MKSDFYLKNLLNTGEIPVGKYFISAFFCLYSISALAQVDFSSAHLFSHKSKQFVSYEAISGAIEYVVDEAGMEGYKPARKIKVEGRYDRTIYDFPDDYSAQQIYSALSRKNIKQGYKLVFSCAGIECGEMLGWKLYLDPLVEGHDKQQYYSLVERIEDGRKKSLLAIYINEFSNQPRVIMDKVSEIKIAPAHTILFEKGSAQLLTEKKKQLESMVPGLRQQQGKLDLIGYSDLCKQFRKLYGDCK